MAETFRRRGARPEVVQIIEDTVCPACVESQMPQPRSTTRLEPNPEMWHTVENDLFEWEHPKHKSTRKGIVCVDAGCRLRVARWIFQFEEGMHRNATGDDLLRQYY